MCLPLILILYIFYSATFYLTAQYFSIRWNDSGPVSNLSCMSLGKYSIFLKGTVFVFKWEVTIFQTATLSEKIKSDLLSKNALSLKQKSSINVWCSCYYCLFIYLVTLPTSSVSELNSCIGKHSSPLWGTFSNTQKFSQISEGINYKLRKKNF
jgi:hypothetical protein